MDTYPIQSILHHWQCAFSAQLPLMLHLLLLLLQTKHLIFAVIQHRCQRQLTFLDPSPVQENLPVLTGRGCAECLHQDRQICIVEGYHQWRNITSLPFYKWLHGGLRDPESIAHIENPMRRLLSPATTSLQCGTPLVQDKRLAIWRVLLKSMMKHA